MVANAIGEMVMEDPNSGPRKRLRLTVVCESCKRKKIKCDKQLPCTACVKAKISSKCVYKSALPYVSSARRPINLHDGDKPNDFHSSADKLFTPSAPLQYPIMQQNQGGMVPPAHKNIIQPDAKFHNSPVNSVSNMRSTNSNHLSNSPLSHNYYSQSQVELPVAQPTQSNNSVSTPNSFDSRSGSFGISNPERYRNSFQADNIVDPSTDSFPRNSSTTSSSSYNHSSHGPSSNSSIPSSASSISVDSARPSYSPQNYSNNISLPPLKRTVNPPPTFMPKKRVVGDTIYSESSRLQSLVGVNPFTSTRDTIDFYQDSEKGIFSMSYLMQTDPGLRCLQKYIQTQTKLDPPDGGIECGDISHDDMKLDIRKIATIKYTQNDGTHPECLYRNHITQSCEKQEEWLTLTLIEKFLRVLPCKDNIWLLIERFFTYAYPFVPIIDEQEFMNKLTLLIGQKTVTDHVMLTRINVTSKHDYITLAQLVMVLRMAYISLFKNNESENMDSLNFEKPHPGMELVQYLLQSRIDTAVVGITEQCLALFEDSDDEENDELAILQLVFLLKVYLKHAPEDSKGGDGEGDLLVSSGVLRRAYKLGLEKDPKITNPDENSNFVHLKRKLWYFIVLVDVFQSYTFGIPPRISDAQYDTLYPVASIENSNLIDYERDCEITLMNYKRADLVASLKLLTEAIVTKERNKCFIVDIVDRLNHFEALYHSDVGKTQNLTKTGFKPDGDDTYERREADLAILTVSRNFNIKYYLSMGSVLMSVHFSLFTHYQSIGDTNIAFFYLKKCLLYLHEVAPHLHRLLDLSDTYSDFMYNPSLQSFIHKTNQIIQVLIVRFSFVLHHNKHNNNLREEEKSYFDLLRKVKDCLVQITDLFMRLISKLAHRYYYSWRISKAGNFFLAIINNNEFYSTVMASRDNKLKMDYVTPPFCKSKLLEMYELVRDIPNLLDENSDTNKHTWNSSASSTSVPTPRTATTIDNMDIDQMWLDVFSNPTDVNKDATLFDLFDDFHFDVLSV